MKIGSISAIGNITSVGSVSAVRKQDVKPVDTESRSIKDEITAVERQKQTVTPQADLSVDEKMRRRQELQQELSSLKTKLRMSEAEASEENRKEAIADEERSEIQETGASEDSKAAKVIKEEAAKAEEKADAAQAKEKEEAAKAERKEAQIGRMKGNASEDQAEKVSIRKQDAEQTNIKETEADKIGADAFGIEERAEKSGVAGADKKTDAKEDKEKASGFSEKEVQSMISEDKAAERAKQQGIIVSRIENDIVILKGEIKQDEARDVDVTKKKEELKEREDRAQWATNAQFSAIGQTNRKLQENTQDKAEEIRGDAAMAVRRNVAEQPLFRATNYSFVGVV